MGNPFPTETAVGEVTEGDTQLLLSCSFGNKLSRPPAGSYRL